MIKNHSESDWEPKNRKNIRICDDMLIRHLLYRQKNIIINKSFKTIVYFGLSVF
jgi:hypothetical protein